MNTEFNLSESDFQNPLQSQKHEYYINEEIKAKYLKEENDYTCFTFSNIHNDLPMVYSEGFSRVNCEFRLKKSFSYDFILRQNTHYRYTESIATALLDNPAPQIIIDLSYYNRKKKSITLNDIKHNLIKRIFVERNIYLFKHITHNSLYNLLMAWNEKFWYGKFKENDLINILEEAFTDENYLNFQISKRRMIYTKEFIQKIFELNSTKRDIIRALSNEYNRLNSKRANNVIKQLSDKATQSGINFKSKFEMATWIKNNCGVELKITTIRKKIALPAKKDENGHSLNKLTKGMTKKDKNWRLLKIQEEINKKISRGLFVEQSEIIQLTGISERTVQRYWKEVKDYVTSHNQKLKQIMQIREKVKENYVSLTERWEIKENVIWLSYVA